MVVDVVLPAVLGLVHVGETGISACAEAFELATYPTAGPPATFFSKKKKKSRKLSQSHGQLAIGGAAIDRAARAGRFVVHVVGGGALSDGLTSCTNAVSLGST